MEKSAQTNPAFFNHILYIGDEPKVCLNIIEKFNKRLFEIEQMYAGWFYTRLPINKYNIHDKLQNHIKYHFEGGIAVFKFRDEHSLPAIIRKECINACRDLAF